MYMSNKEFIKGMLKVAPAGILAFIIIILGLKGLWHFIAYVGG